MRPAPKLCITHESPGPLAILAATTAGLGDDVSHLYYWDEGHGANTDAGDFVAWIAKVSGYKKRVK
ncbi:hypothetical protein RKD49_003583 [Streptomyces glaucescens]